MGDERCSAKKCIEAKIVILGEQNVGKTSFVIVYNPDRMADELATVSPTVGATFATFRVPFGNTIVRMQVWDTAGQERFRSMAPLYYRKANAAVIMYDISIYESFLAAKSWVQELKRNIEAPVLMLLVGNKADLASARAVARDEALRYATTVGASFCETSATKSEGVSEAFTQLARNLIQYEEVHSNFQYKLNSSNVNLDESLEDDRIPENLCC